MRQNASTVAQLKEATLALKHSNESVGLLNRHMVNQKYSLGSKLHLLLAKLGGMKDKVDALCPKQDAHEAKHDAPDLREASLYNVSNLAEARNIKTLMGEMRKSMDNANDTIHELSKLQTS